MLPVIPPDLRPFRPLSTISLSFRPVITDHLTISRPPLVCGGFNADFDGDTMALLYLPLTAAAQGELRRRCRPEMGHWEYCPYDDPWRKAILQGAIHRTLQDGGRHEWHPYKSFI